MEAHIQPYVAYLREEQNVSPQTLRAYEDDLRSYMLYVSERLQEDWQPSAGDLDLVRGWLSSQMDQGLKASSVSRRLSAVKSFYRYLLKQGAIDKNPIATLRPPRGERPLPVYVPTNELERILSDAPSAQDDWQIWRDHLIIAMLYECGLRRSELAGLSDVNVDTQARQLKVLGKGNKERIVPFGQSLSEKITQWRRVRTEVFGYCKSFFITLSGEAMTGAGVYRVVHRALATVPNLSRRGAHALRHSFATDMLGAGADLMAIKELMGHRSISTTVGYTHTSFAQLRQMYNAHPRAQKKKT